MKSGKYVPKFIFDCHFKFMYIHCDWSMDILKILLFVTCSGRFFQLRIHYFAELIMLFNQFKSFIKWRQFDKFASELFYCKRIYYYSEIFKQVDLIKQTTNACIALLVFYLDVNIHCNFKWIFYKRLGYLKTVT